MRLASPRITGKRNFTSMQSQEVSRAHSIRLTAKKGQIQSGKKLHPQYIAGFIDGEGSFSVSIYRDETMKNKIFVRPEFEIELRADDKEILERIQETLGGGKIYQCNYERYGWYPHAKFKISSLAEIQKILIPFLEKCPLQAKKAKVFGYFKQIVQKRAQGEHLTEKGVAEIIKLRDQIRLLGKKHRLETARVRESRSPSGVGRRKLA